MDTDCKNVMMYPNKHCYYIENILSFICLSWLIVYVASWPGVIGIILVGVNLIFRFYFKHKLVVMDDDLEKFTKARVMTTIEVINIIKFIKANALEACYYNKLRQLRLD